MPAPLAIRAVIQAIDKITGPVRKIAAAVRDRLGGAFRSTLGGVKAASAKLGEWTMLAGKAAILGAGALVVGLGAATAAYLENAGGLADLSGQLGVSVEFLQELRYAAGLAGVGAEELDGGLEALAKGLGQARAGTGKMAAFLGKVSPALLKQVKGAKSVEEAFDLMTTAISAVKDPARRAALATAAFGAAGPQIARVLGEGTEGLAKIRAEFRKTGAGLSGEQVAAADELGDNLDKLKLSLSGVANVLVSRIVPVLGPLVEKFTAWIQANREIVAVKLEQVISGIADAIASIDWPAVVAGAREVAAGIRYLWDVIGGAKGATVIYAGVLSVQLLSAISSAIPAITMIGGAFKALWLVMLANPVALVIAALIGSLALVYANWADFEEFGAELWRTLKVLWIDGVKNISELWAELARTGTQVWVDFKASIAAVWDGIVGVFTGAWAKISGIVDNVTAAAAEVAGFLGIDTGRRAPSTGAPGAPLPSLGALGPAASLPSGQTVATAQGGGATAQVSGGVTVRFDNAPPGLRVADTRRDTPGFGVGASVGRRGMATGIQL